MANSVRITNEKLDFSREGRLIISDTNMINQLIQRKEEVLEMLRRDKPNFDIRNIQIDESGRIIIEDEEFKARILNKANDPLASVDGNTVCGCDC